MSVDFELVKPKIVPPLDDGFRPAVLINNFFKQIVANSGVGVPLVFGLSRPDGSLSRYKTVVFPEGDSHSQINLLIAERIFKFLLWQYGGCKVYVGGPKSIGEYIQRCYCAGGVREFDFRFMSEHIYGEPFTIIPCDAKDVPPSNEIVQPIGGHLEGYRIGFDLGASDRKVAAVVDGKEIFSEEVIWDPSTQSDPQYHYDEVMMAIKKAASKMPRLDAIGGSSAGIYIDNKVRVASLFRGVPRHRFEEVRNMFLRIRQEMGVPLVVVNDGEVTALAGAMSLESNSVLGVALGSSQAAGYVTPAGAITGWLNELAFAPVDYSPTAPREDWSGDYGVGALYLSQQAVFRLAPKVGIDIPANLGKAQKLAYVQDYLQRGHTGAAQIWQTIGVYLGYTIAHYADYYILKHVLILGRCTSGKGGPIILEWANRVLQTEFPALCAAVHIQLPDEKNRRVGQSIAAASLPKID